MPFLRKKRGFMMVAPGVAKLSPDSKNSVPHWVYDWGKGKLRVAAI